MKKKNGQRKLRILLLIGVGDAISSFEEEVEEDDLQLVVKEEEETMSY